MADMSKMAELPQYGIAVTPPENNPLIYLTINYGTASMQFYLCDTTNYEDVARIIHKNIMDAGLAAKRAKTGLVIAKGDLNATLPKAQGGRQRSQGGPRPARP